MHKNLGLIHDTDFILEIMAEPEKERDIEIEKIEEYQEEEENGVLSQLHGPNTFLAELNMLLVLLSLFYFSTDDCIENEEGEQMIRDQVGVTKTCLSRFPTKRRGIHEPKLGRRSFSSRSQTTIRDSR